MLLRRLRYLYVRQLLKCSRGGDGLKKPYRRTALNDKVPHRLADAVQRPALGRFGSAAKGVWRLPLLVSAALVIQADG